MRSDILLLVASGLASTARARSIPDMRKPSSGRTLFKRMNDPYQGGNDDFAELFRGSGNGIANAGRDQGANSGQNNLPAQNAQVLGTGLASLLSTLDLAPFEGTAQTTAATLPQNQPQNIDLTESIIRFTDDESQNVNNNNANPQLQTGTNIAENNQNQPNLGGQAPTAAIEGVQNQENISGQRAPENAENIQSQQNPIGQGYPQQQDISQQQENLQQQGNIPQSLVEPVQNTGTGTNTANENLQDYEDDVSETGYQGGKLRDYYDERKELLESLEELRQPEPPQPKPKSPEKVIDLTKSIFSSDYFSKPDKMQNLMLINQQRGANRDPKRPDLQTQKAAMTDSEQRRRNPIAIATNERGQFDASKLPHIQDIKHSMQKLVPGHEWAGYYGDLEDPKEESSLGKLAKSIGKFGKRIKDLKKYGLKGRPSNRIDASLESQPKYGLIEPGSANVDFNTVNVPQYKDLNSQSLVIAPANEERYLIFNSDDKTKSPPIVNPSLSEAITNNPFVSSQKTASKSTSSGDKTQNIPDTYYLRR